jgi:hypothetical protein
MGKIYLNPPPADRKCERCGKHIDELEPFDGEIYKGSKLVKTYRGMCDYSQKYEDMLAEIFIVPETNYSERLEKAEKKYGKEEVEHAMLYDEVYNTIGASWECKDCIKKD